MLRSIKKWFNRAFWLAVFLLCTFITFRQVPEQHNPIVPLRYEAPIGAATQTKLASLQNSPKKCFAFLAQADISFTRLPDTDDKSPCHFKNVATLDQSLLPYSTPLQMTCQLTAGLAVWERQSLVLRVKQHFNAPASEMLSYGSFNCRRLYGRKTGKYSEHATANAIDIRGVVLADGTTIRVKDHWGENTPEGKFLKEIRNDACRVFGTVLGPEYNNAHADHFHFDMSQTGICR